MMTTTNRLSARLSRLGTLQTVIAEATRAFQAGEIDEAGYVAMLERHGFGAHDARAEADYQRGRP